MHVLALVKAWFGGVEDSLVEIREVQEYLTLQLGVMRPSRRRARLNRSQKWVKKSPPPATSQQADEEEEPVEQGQDDKNSVDIDLDGTGETIVDTLGKNEIDAAYKRWIGKKIATEAKMKFNSHFKSTLSHLRQDGILTNPGRGYYPDEKGLALHRKRKEERAKGQDKVRVKSGSK